MNVFKTVNLTPDMPVGLRLYQPTDEGFVYRSWLKSHHDPDNGDWPKRLGGCCSYSHRRYYDTHKLVIADILSRSFVRVACNPAVPWQALGFIVFEIVGDVGVLHWLHVKSTMRLRRLREMEPLPVVAGIGEALLRQAAETVGADGVERELWACSHWSRAAERWRANGWRLRYDPFLLEKR